MEHGGILWQKITRRFDFDIIETQQRFPFLLELDTKIQKPNPETGSIIISNVYLMEFYL